MINKVPKSPSSDKNSMYIWCGCVEHPSNFKVLSIYFSLWHSILNVFNPDPIKGLSLNIFIPV